MVRLGTVTTAHLYSPHAENRDVDRSADGESGAPRCAAGPIPLDGATAALSRGQCGLTCGFRIVLPGTAPHLTGFRHPRANASDFR